MSDTSTYDGIRPVSDAHRFNEEALLAWLKSHIPGLDGKLQVDMFKGGQSNPTYRLSLGNRQFVMRAKPGPAAKLLPSAHAIEREFKVMDALSQTNVPVAKMHALCEDESVIGRAFFIMDFVQGRVLWDQSLPGMTPAQRAAIYDEMNRVMSALHSVNPDEIGLSDYGRPGNYIERQIARWSKQYRASITEPVPAMDQLMDWLPANLPASAQLPRISVVHGDYRMDNMIFHPTEPKVLAVLDWELSTLGHPLADFSYHCMSWHIEPGTFRGIGGLNLAELGIPSEIDYIRRYCERTGFCSVDTLVNDWNFYLAYNLFRMSAILQGIAKRIEEGTASSDQAKRSAAGARPMAELAWKLATSKA
ncbi:MAG: hypothetical protein RL307_508 [Pseudomonadota bacterium]|jgi:aminoglycoside phosphotransferase (APT) family kinase protein